MFPKTFLPDDVHKIELVNFSQIQQVLIKFYNDDQDEMFRYYDNRMSSRFHTIKDEQEQNNEMVSSILKDLANVNSYMD